MKLSTAITVRVAAAFLVFLLVIAANFPKVGIPLAAAWILLVLWQLIRQRQQNQ